MSSRDVVNIVGGVVNAGVPRKQRLKIGHTGTLDPLASGVLVVAIGPATRLTYLIGDMPKRYLGTFRLGESTDSGDLDGELTRHDLPMPTESTLRDAAAGHVGHIDQTPPAHSAIHIDGVKAYKRVRAGETVEMPSRRVRIDSIEVTRYEPPEFDIDVVCGGGTYMRTLGFDIAAAAGNVAVMTGLVRTAVGGFQINDAIDASVLKQGDWWDRVRPPADAASALPTLTLDDSMLRRIADGGPLPIDILSSEDRERLTAMPVAASSEVPSPGEIAAVDDRGNLRAIMIADAARLRCRKVFRA